MDKKVIKFLYSQKKFNFSQTNSNRKFKNKIDRSLERIASEKFAEAIYEKDINRSYALALEAYELNPDEYSYKVYAISKIENSNEREIMFFDLINDIKKKINDSRDGLFYFYDTSEFYKKRYKDLLYKYIICLIENRKYDDALIQLNRFDSIYYHFEYKVKHLIMNILLYKNEFKLFYDEIKMIEDEENLLYYLPRAYYLYKQGEIDESIKIINKAISINNYLIDIFRNLNDDCLIEKINKSKERYKLRSKEEALFCFKYFYFIYIDDEGFKKLLLNV